jgi:hypothetical protein
LSLTAGSPLGVAVVVYVALDMIWRGMNEVMNAAAW